MADINEILHTIASAIYGKDVRQGIYDAIDFIHNEYMVIKTVADQMHELIGMYEGYVAQAIELTADLKVQIDTGTSLRDDLVPLNETLSDGRQVLAELKTQNGNATTNIQTAQEKIEILQSLLAQIPDLDTASQIADRLEAAYNSAVEAVGMIEPVEELVRQLTEQNTLAQSNLEEFLQFKTDIETLKETVNQLSEQVAGYPEIIEQLQSAYQGAVDALEKLTNAEETVTTLNQLNTEAQDYLGRYDQAKATIDELVQKTTEIETKVADYPDLVQRLENAYNEVKNSTINIEELRDLLNEIEPNITIINENKESVSTVAQSMDIIKQFIELGGVDVSQFEQRLSTVESTLDGLAETLERLV